MVSYMWAILILKLIIIIITILLVSYCVWFLTKEYKTPFQIQKEVYDENKHLLWRMRK